MLARYANTLREWFIFGRYELIMCSVLILIFAMDFISSPLFHILATRIDVVYVFM